MLIGTHTSSMTTEMVWQRVGEGKALDAHLFLVSGGDAAGSVKTQRMAGKHGGARMAHATHRRLLSTWLQDYPLPHDALSGFHALGIEARA